jgi:hypothetical protein
MTERNTVSTFAPRAEGLPDRPSGTLVSVVPRAARAPALWLAFIVGASVLVRGAIAVNVPSAWILPDEVVYSDVAKSIAAGGFPTVRGVQELGWGVVYQAVIAPAWVVFADPLRAYHVALAVNALVMSLAALPAYFLARMFVERTASVVVAAMTVLVPSMAYTGVLMTENACYPAFLLSVLLIARALRSPSAINQALALVGLGVVALTRIQAAALVGAYFVAIVLYAWLGPRSERRPYLGRFVPTVVVSALASFAPMAGSLAHGDGATGWLGSRSGTFDALEIHEVPQWFVFLAAELVLYVALVPAASTAIVLGRGLSRQDSESVRLFTAVALSTLLTMLVSVSFVSASLDVDGRENLNERYVFYVVPLLFVGLALWIREGLPRPRPWAWLTLALCSLIPALIPIGRLSYNAGFQSVALLPWIRLDASYGVVAVLVAGFTLTCGALWLLCRRDRAGYLWILVALWMTATGAITVMSNGSSAANWATAFTGRPANWVDRAVPPGSHVAVVWEQGQEKQALRVEFWLMVTELFNRSVGNVYRIGGPTYYEGFLPTVPVEVGPDGQLISGSERLAVRYALVTCRTPLIGHVVATGPRRALRLVRVDGPLRLAKRPSCGGPPTT